MDQASSGLEALERVQAAEAADVVLLDLQPGDGEALHTLRWMRRVSPDVPIVLVSHQRNTKEVLDALQLGARGCLLKPVAPREFEAVIMQHLQKSTDGGSPRGEKSTSTLSAGIAHSFGPALSCTSCGCKRKL